MIHAALSHMAGQLNQFLKRTFELTEDPVVLSSILEQDGTLAPDITNKLVVFLVNTQKETAHGRQSVSIDSWGSAYPPIMLNLYVMVAANFSGKNYGEGLKYLSNAVSFFQRQPVFDQQQTPDLDRRIGKLILDIENLSIQDMSSLWGSLSGHYLPSILYRVRMVAFDANDILSTHAPVRGVQPTIGF